MVFDPAEQTRSQSSYDIRKTEFKQASAKKNCSAPDLVVSLSSEFCIDDASVSSISSNESFQPRRRSIFSSTMNDQQDRVSRTQNRSALSATASETNSCPFSLDSDDEYQNDQHENFYEVALKRREKLDTPRPRSTPLCGFGNGIFGGCTKNNERRKSCFGSFNFSVSGMTRRNAFSDSALVVKDLRSCLKASKLSRNDRDRVSFSTTVSVIDYQVDEEQFSSPGWSQYFH